MTKNQLGYQILGPNMVSKILGPNLFEKLLTDQEISEIIERFHYFDLPNPLTFPEDKNLYDQDFKVPELLGKDIEEHFENMSHQLVGNLRELLDKFAAIKTPKFPAHFNFFEDDYTSRVHGWYRYIDKEEGYWEQCDEISEKVAVFDCETFVQSPCGNWAVIGTAVTEHYYYLWIHKSFHYDMEFEKELIDLGNTVEIVIGHNVCFDYARVSDTYKLSRPRYRYIDTRSMFNICHGLTSSLMGLFEDEGFDEKKNPYCKYGSKADLVSAYNFYFRHDAPMKKDAKEIRDVFVDCSTIKEMHDIAGRDKLYEYAMRDVYYTFKLFSAVWEEYCFHCPTDTALTAMTILGSPKITLDERWYEWFENCEKEFHKDQKFIADTFQEMADETVAYPEKGVIIEDDPWLSQMDWSANTSMSKKVVKVYELYDVEGTTWTVKVPHGAPVGETLEEFAEPKDFFVRTKSGGLKKKKIDEEITMEPTYPNIYGVPRWYLKACKSPITAKSQLSHYLLRLSWSGQPIIMTPDQGWCISREGLYEKVPHKKGKEFNVGNMLTKDFIEYYEKGLMGAENDKARAIMDASVRCSYWLSVRSRVADVLINKSKNPFGADALVCGGEVAPHNTVSGRGGQRLWYTVPGAQAHKIGTEIKTRVKAPEGWSIVGGDIDGQELQIFSMYADCKYGVSGSSPVAFSVINGNKDDKTEPHWLLAKLAEIERKGAKTINYGIQYGAGFPTVDQTLAKLNPLMPEADRHQLVFKILKLKKGTKMGTGRNARYKDGMDSEGFNYMLDLIDEFLPRTPFLETIMSKALMPDYDVQNRNFTSVQNWTIQRSGADFLACMIVACEYLSKKFNLDALFMISMHDEIFYLVPSYNEMKFAACFLMAHIWTWAFFQYKLGLYDIPLRRIYISGVYVGNRWSKSLDSTKTVSNPVNDQEGREVTHNELIPFLEALLA